MISQPSTFINVLDNLQRSNFNFKLSGSQFYESCSLSSDYDFIVDLFPNDSVLGFEQRIKTGLIFLLRHVKEFNGSYFDPRKGDNADDFSINELVEIKKEKQSSLGFSKDMLATCDTNNLTYFDINCCGVFQLKTSPLKIDIVIPCNFYRRVKLDEVLKNDGKFLNTKHKLSNVSIQDYIEKIYINHFGFSLEEMLNVKMERIKLLTRLLDEIENDSKPKNS